jgi:small subunit ribosomal protein S6
MGTGISGGWRRADIVGTSIRLDPATRVGVGRIDTSRRSLAPGTAGTADAQALLPRRRRGRLSPKEVETALRAYEVMVILNPDLEERTVAPSLDTYLNVVRQDGGSIENVDVWGRRRLAYEIDKNAEGIYAVVTLNAEPATVKELDRQLSLNESVLRTKVIRPDLR